MLLWGGAGYCHCHEELNAPTSGLTCIQSRYKKRLSVSICDGGSSGERIFIPRILTWPDFPFVVDGLLEHDRDMRAVLEDKLSFHLPFVEFGQNAPDELIRVPRPMSVSRLGMEGERRDIRVPLSILPIVTIPCNFCAT